MILKTRPQPRLTQVQLVVVGCNGHFIITACVVSISITEDEEGDVDFGLGENTVSGQHQFQFSMLKIVVKHGDNNLTSNEDNLFSNLTAIV